MKKILLSTALLCSNPLWAGFDFEECSGVKTFTQHISNFNGDLDSDVLVGTIPKGIQGLTVVLSSDKDIDIRLYGEDNDKVVHWPEGIIDTGSYATDTYHDTAITYSGYNGINNQRGHESIKVAGSTPTNMTVKVFGYEEGDATVVYRWTGKDHCNNAGHFLQDIQKDQTVTVGEIPAGIKDLNISLKSDKDVDIQLFAEDGTAIIAWNFGILHGPNKSTVNYNGMEIEWSGFEGTNNQPGHEYIKITGNTTETVTMKVYGYEAGSAEVDYNWAK